MPHNRGTQNELIFVNNLSDGNAIEVVSEPVENILAGEQVDLEIIILAPKRKKKQKRVGRRNKLRRLRQDSRTNQVDEDDDEESSPDSQTGPEQSTKEPQPEKPGEASPKVSAALLKRLETRYGRKVLKPDDDTYVDYMDYF